MANARSRLNETKSVKTQGRGRPRKSSPKPTRLNPQKNSKPDESIKLSKVSKNKTTERMSRSSLSSESKEKQAHETPKSKMKLKSAKSKPKILKKYGPSEQLHGMKRTAKKSPSMLLEPQDNLVNILTEELTKKVSKNNFNTPLEMETETEEPQIITMKRKSSLTCVTDKFFNPTPSTSDYECILTPLLPNKVHAVPMTSESLQTEYMMIEQDGKTWTVPKPLKPSEYNLVLPVDEHKDEKIADINVLRRMLKQSKVRLSNGVQISLPSSVNAIFECDDCGKMFRTKQDLRKHMLIHLDLRPHACTKCAASFRQRGNLKTHMMRMHFAELAAPEHFICDLCGARFFIKENIRSHILKHEPMRTFDCQECGKSFSRSVLLDAHIRSQHGPPQFYCYLCSAPYPSRAALDSHTKRHLTSTRDLVCSPCGEVFPGITALKKHMEMHHYGAKRFQCPVCSKQLKGHMREHLRTHASSKPYVCIECGKGFTQTSQLAVHKRSHTGQKPYVCRVCKRPFSHSNALILHIRIHTGEKPFKCAMCPQAFSQLPHMKSHMQKIHNKREAYKCRDCGEFFKLQASLERHRLGCSNATPWLDELPDSPLPPDGPVMSITKMRFLLAILLQTIADQHRLHLLGFNKRLIDELLVDSLEATGHEPCTDLRKPAAVRLRDNIQLLLNWTVPPDVMRRYQEQNKTTEQLLEELTS